ncbi:germ cell nuclear acidic protein [Ochotona princeps]|uniref:germ cell nuclear acidic protein n=1 Tax=Ochotona princeps TaxID=9978 RepID=UPI0027144D15|nr:germ cell nuclear acidic protein [Ochotona princeps]
MHKSAGPQRNSFEINDEETSNESIFVLSSDSESSLEAINMRMPGDEPIMTVEKPREKTTKRVFMKSDVSGRKKCRRLKRKLSDQKAGTCDTGKSKCNIPGCFLLELETSKRYTGKNFKHNRDELAQKIYKLINRTVFDQKMPEKIEIGWNKKMLKTAGLCSSGELQSPEKQRFAKIEISLKVCDSADRLRDTLIHELCHAASWLLDGVRDSHGDMWQNYARKCNMIHPELPKVTRCHNYQINYKILYECTKCKNRVGRYTRSLNTNLFTCAKCRGKLVLLPLTQKDGTPIRPHVRPFAKYVKENYGIISKSKEGITHGEIMKRLSKDYVAKKQKGNI